MKLLFTLLMALVLLVEKISGSETFSTIGIQKKTNYALQEMTKEQFIKSVTSGLSEPPPYFPLNAQLNKEGYPSMDGVLKEGLTPLNVEEFKKEVK